MNNVIKNRINSGLMIFKILAVSLVIFLVGCEEAERFKISGKDNTPPGKPTFVESKPLPGGARIFFVPPTDQDVLYIEASYKNVAGITIRFAASFAAGSVDVYGFNKEGEHTVDLCAVDRAGNRSESIQQKVTALEPIVVSVAKTITVLPSFSSILLKWKTTSSEPLYVGVDISYTQNNIRQDYSAVFNTNQTETRSLDSLKLFAGEPVSVKVSLWDKYDNVVQAKDTTIVLLTDDIIPKNGWSLPNAGTILGGITQVGGLRVDMVIDGVIDIDIENFFVTTQANPWNMIIDLGKEYEISRIVTHQRWSGYSTSFGSVNVRGNLYRGDNVLSSNLYGWDNTSQSWYLWSGRIIPQPSVLSDGEYTIMGKTGDMAFIFPDEPQFSSPTRYVRFEAVNGKYISEITLYGREAK